MPDDAPQAINHSATDRCRQDSDREDILRDTSLEDNCANHFIEVPSRCVSPDGRDPHNFDSDSESDSDDEGGQILADNDSDVDVAQVESEGRPVDVTVTIEAAHTMTMMESDPAGTTGATSGATDSPDAVDTHSTSNDSESANNPESISVQSRHTRAAHQLYIEHLPIGMMAGEPLAGAAQQKDAFEVYRDSLRERVDTEASIWAPFRSKMDWELARWAKLRGPGSTAVSELLCIDGVSTSSCHLSSQLLTYTSAKIKDALGLSYKNSRELNNIIDSQLPGLPRFEWKEVKIGEKRFDIYF